MSPPDASAAARQWLETGRLLGVPFAPVALRAVPAAAPAPSPAPATSSPPAAPRDVPVAPAATPQPRTPPPAVAPPASPAVFTADLPADPGEALATLAARYEQLVVPRVTDHAFTKAVFGEGDPRASLVIVGEAPGAEEDRSGRPFVGPAGRKLDQMLGAIGLERSAVYIANVVKIRPPGNRTPLAHEVDRCGPWLAAQLRIIRPRAILALGGPASKWLLDSDAGITRLRGVWSSWVDEGGGSGGGRLEIPVLPSFHPAYLLRHYTRETREQMWHDLQAVKARLEASAAPAAPATPAGPAA